MKKKNLRRDIFCSYMASREKYLEPSYEPDAELNKAPKSGNIERVIFAPDPSTGLPMSDLSLPLDVANDPGVREYVDKWLHKDMSAKVENSNIMDVDDFDVNQIKSRRAQYGQERQSYILGLKEQVDSYYRQQKEIETLKNDE